MEDWAGLSAILTRSRSGDLSQRRQASSASSRAWSKPRFRRRFLLTGTQVTTSNSPENSSAAQRARSSPKERAAERVPRNFKRKSPSRATPSYQRGAAQRKLPTLRTVWACPTRGSFASQSGQMPFPSFPHRGHRGGKRRSKIFSKLPIFNCGPAATAGRSSAAAACRWRP